LPFATNRQPNLRRSAPPRWRCSRRCHGEPTAAEQPRASDHDAEAAWRSENDAVDLHEGSVVHDWYRLESLLGVGAMGQGWKALDLQRARAHDPQPYVALKLIGHEFGLLVQ